MTFWRELARPDAENTIAYRTMGPMERGETTKCALRRYIVVAALQQLLMYLQGLASDAVAKTAW